MRIVLDLQSLQTGSRYRGMGRYSLSLARAMITEGQRHEFLIVLNHAFPDTVEDVRQAFADLLPPGKIVLFRTPTPVIELYSEGQWRRSAAELIREHFLQQLQPDWVHVSSLFERTNNSVTSIGRFAPLPTAVTLYDLIPYFYPEHYLPFPLAKSWYGRKLVQLRQAEILLAISEHTRKEAIEVLGLPADRVINISADADAGFQVRQLGQQTIGELRAHYGLSRAFVMCTGGMEYRKNIEGLMEAYARLSAELRANHQLAVCCGIEAEERHRLSGLASRLGLSKDEMILTGYVSDEELMMLYNLCKLFVFPSLHEGFGLPVLEAMRCGAVVIGSNTTSIPEVIGLKDALFDPTSISNINEKLYQALTDDQFRQRLRENGQVQASKFSWSDSARRTMEALEMGYERRQHVPRQVVPVLGGLPKLRLAYVSPLPPEKSGIADYSTELLPELAQYYEIDLVTDLKDITDPRLADFRRHSVEEFSRGAGEYDRVLYHFGNSAFHSHTFQLLPAFPGTVVLHDFFSGAALGHLEQTTSPPIFQQALYRSHGYPALRLWHEKGIEEATRTYPCCLEILQYAQGVIVHSEQDLKLAEQISLLKGKEYFCKISRLEHIPEQSKSASHDDVEIPVDAAKIAQQLADAIEYFYQNHPIAKRRQLLSAIAALPAKSTPSKKELAAAAAAIAENALRDGRRQLLVDIGELALLDPKTRIQRVTRSILQQLLASAPAGYRVEPVYCVKGIYRYARRFMARWLDIDGFGLADVPVDVAPGDIFIGLDLDPRMSESARDWLRHHARRGLKVYFIVYDLLPLLRPDWFAPLVPPMFRAWLEGIAGMADGLVCISRTLADELGRWLEQHAVPRTRPLNIGYFHLGADIEASLPTSGVRSGEAGFLSGLDNKTSFLMVATVEPRKGHAQALEAFEELWGAGEEVRLIVVGRPGWGEKKLIKRLRSHPEQGKRLVWLEQASDELLLKLYRSASALLMASQGEGFGLPLVEAARHGLPIITRDLPVMREIAGNHAFYFTGREAGALADALKTWLGLYRQGKHPRSDGIRWLTWEESAGQLKKVLFESHWVASWEPKSGFCWHVEDSSAEKAPG